MKRARVEHTGMEVLRAAIYARVSTEDQNCEMQLRELREYVRRRGWAVTGEYVDTGWSGTKRNRPQLDACMASARSRKIDCIVVWKLDRWGRSLAHCIESLNELRGVGVRWIAVTQNLDTDESNAVSRAMVGMLAVFAEFEREMIRERVMAGLKAARIRGRKGGRPRRVFSHDRALELRARGLSLAAIAKKLAVGRGTIERLVRASRA